jgi:glycosyltransferase involved in cell wall biosynthesis
MSASLSVVVTTFNEEANIKRCLESIAGWADEIFVVDSFSTDATLEIVNNYTDKIVQHVYEGAPDQWRWALDELHIGGEWLLALDADYWVTRELRDSIQKVLQSDDGRTDGYYAAHRQMFRGRFIRHGGLYPRHRLILMRRVRVVVDEQDRVESRLLVPGATQNLAGDVVEENTKDADFAFWIQKQMRLAQKAAAEEISRKRVGRRGQAGSLLKGRNERVLWLKRRWGRLPLYWRSVGYFLFRYVFRGGFLDGKEGFLYHFSQALVFRVALDVCVEELGRQEQRGGKHG